MTEQHSRWRKVEALVRVSKYRPALTVGVIALSLVAAVLEGVGISFLIPIIEQARSQGGPPADSGGLLGVFADTYAFVGVPFTLEFIIAGVVLVMVVRFTASFLVSWLRAKLRTDYIRYLQTKLFEKALDARVRYFDEHGSDEVLNAIVTQATYAGESIRQIVLIVQVGLVALVYFLIAMYLAPMLTTATAIVLGGAIYALRGILESGYDVGDRVADANERVQEAVQAGTQGIRDVKLFGMSHELFADFKDAVDQFAHSTIQLRRNEAAISNFYQLAIAVTVFTLIYFAVTFSSLSLSSLGLFLFAVFRLGPKLSLLNNYLYSAEGNLPHLIRTQEYIEDLEANKEPTRGTASLPEDVEKVTYDDVSFTYDTGETVLDDLSFSVERGEFVAFVGPSGVGKSTIVSLLTRMYDPDEGTISADCTPIDEVDIEEWRSHVSVIRQDPHIFNETMEYNLTVGNRHATSEQIQRACETAQVTEFLNELPEGYDTQLGDDGVRLSGGQRQRIAIARALLEDGDILVLDEATSDLDTALENEVHSNIESLDRDYAMIVIAHRLSTVTNADRIYTMEGGNIAERGSHEELLDEDGHYASLYSVQT